jgi:hypothetical protein
MKAMDRWLKACPSYQASDTPNQHEFEIIGMEGIFFNHATPSCLILGLISNQRGHYFHIPPGSL